ncbi:hypothetical protein RFI_34353, partial [Reticulomyxa filosa]
VLQFFLQSTVFDNLLFKEKYFRLHKFKIILPFYFEDLRIVELLLLIAMISKYYAKCSMYLSFQIFLFLLNKNNLQSFSFFCKQKLSVFFILHNQRSSQEKAKQSKEEEETQIIVHHWIRILNIKLGWIKNFDKLVINY